MMKDYGTLGIPTEREVVKVTGKWPVVLGTLIAAAAAIFVVAFAVINVRSGLNDLNEYNADFESVIEQAQDNYKGSNYIVTEKEGYLIEAFPFGCSDDLEHNAQGIRLIKTTWYNHNRTNVAAVDYGIIPEVN